jgi:uncharacterized protein YdiU (UPF0061 family)
MGAKKTKAQVRSLQQEKAFHDDTLYSSFDQLDGYHPWMEQVPEGYVPYLVRQYLKGKVTYFNFKLAKEMGLIDHSHPEVMNRELEYKILETFSLRIINEFDLERGRRVPEERVKPSLFMATRYLQLQHPDKRGTTSGDGRGIWNGVFQGHGDCLWDVSSRGTGVTVLSPGSVEAGRPLPSGNTEVGYGCGLAEIDELYSSAIMAEVIHNRGLRTERVLAIIDHGNGFGIGVRAGKNLLRPAHLFLFLKQQKHKALKRALNYLIQRQYKNKEWGFSERNPRKYHLFLEKVCVNFAEFAARLERQYLFTWLDWDGDNVLATAGIIDYGSIRQLGLRHDQYRYDDIQRWSTNLNEQKRKARLMVQVFVQLVDFLKTGKKRPLKNFRNSPWMKKFDKSFQQEKAQHFLEQIGFSKRQSQIWFRKKPLAVLNLLKNFESLEKVKTKGAWDKLPDGINKPAAYNMRALLRELPHCFDSNGSWQEPSYDHIFSTILSQDAYGEERLRSPYYRRRVRRFVNQYKSFLLSTLGPKIRKRQKTLLARRSKELNPKSPVTGNGLILTVHEILESRNEGMPAKDIQKVITELILEHSPQQPKRKEEKPSARIFNLLERIQGIIKEHSEDI